MEVESKQERRYERLTGRDSERDAIGQIAQENKTRERTNELKKLRNQGIKRPTNKQKYDRQKYARKNKHETERKIERVSEREREREG